MTAEGAHYKLEIPTGYHDSPIPTFPSKWRSMFSLTKFNGMAFTHTWFTIATVFNCLFTLLVFAVSMAGGSTVVIGILWVFFVFPTTQIVIRIMGELIISVLSVPHLVSAQNQVLADPAKIRAAVEDTR
eukprot:TRINITY_DN1128_c0_g1_i1.p1 TRINITY_DN1128_c0_g1~~TRINITY_DN1128_c0_g1_i1.p1  ORF type:complete len:129 (+),score=17.73 TRINITY_DN1128_c0_g1_i1:114-500(+)